MSQRLLAGDGARASLGSGSGFGSVAGGSNKRLAEGEDAGDCDDDGEGEGEGDDDIISSSQVNYLTSREDWDELWDRLTHECQWTESTVEGAKIYCRPNAKGNKHKFSDKKMVGSRHMPDRTRPSSPRSNWLHETPTASPPPPTPT